MNITQLTKDYDKAQSDFNKQLDKKVPSVFIEGKEFDYSFVYREIMPIEYFVEFENFIRSGIVVGDYEEGEK
jgi:hypothetical protein